MITTHRSLSIRFVLAFGLLIASLALTVTPAAAFSDGGGSRHCGDDTPGQGSDEALDCVAAVGTSHDIQNPTQVGPNGGAVAFQCNATAEFALATTVSSCEVRDADSGVVRGEAPAAGASGPQAVTAGAFTIQNTVDVEICWTATALFESGAVETFGCSDVAI
jgi:hypothetical protein